MVVISIVAVMGLALCSIILFFYKTNTYVLEQGTATQSAQKGLLTSMQELREASYGDDGSFPIGSAATSSITFYSDIHNTDDVQEITFWLYQGTLYRDVIVAAGSPPSYSGQPNSTTTIASYVVNATSTPIFQYTDDTGAPLSSPVNVSDIASINTTLQIDVDKNRSPSTYTLTGQATLRNLRD